MTEDDDVEDLHVVAVPAIRGEPVEGVAAVRDMDGMVVAAEEWVRVRCVRCGDEASTPAPPPEIKPDPETGVFSALCGRCAVGHRVSFAEAVDPPLNRRDRRAKRRHSR